MSHLKYFSYAGNTHYSQAVRIPKGDQIVVSGQPGLNWVTRELSNDLTVQVDQAFRNVDQYVKEAGGSGINQVYKLTVYCAPLDSEISTVLEKMLRTWFPDHAPTLTGIGVEKLALPGMRIEVEAWAHVPE